MHCNNFCHQYCWGRIRDGSIWPCLLPCILDLTILDVLERQLHLLSFPRLRDSWGFVDAFSLCNSEQNSLLHCICYEQE